MVVELTTTAVMSLTWTTDEQCSSSSLLTKMKRATESRLIQNQNRLKTCTAHTVLELLFVFLTQRHQMLEILPFSLWKQTQKIISEPSSSYFYLSFQHWKCFHSVLSILFSIVDCMGAHITGTMLSDCVPEGKQINTSNQPTAGKFRLWLWGFVRSTRQPHWLLLLLLLLGRINFSPKVISVWQSIVDVWWETKHNHGANLFTARYKLLRDIIFLYPPPPTPQQKWKSAKHKYRI